MTRTEILGANLTKACKWVFAFLLRLFTLTNIISILALAIAYLSLTISRKSLDTSLSVDTFVKKTDALIEKSNKQIDKLIELNRTLSDQIELTKKQYEFMVTADRHTANKVKINEYYNLLTFCASLNKEAFNRMNLYVSISLQSFPSLAEEFEIWNKEESIIDAYSNADKFIGDSSLKKRFNHFRYMIWSKCQMMSFLINSMKISSNKKDEIYVPNKGFDAKNFKSLDSLSSLTEHDLRDYWLNQISLLSK